MSRQPASILSRILWLHAAAIVVTSIVVATVVYLFLDSTADRLQRQTLLSHAQMLARALEPVPNGSWRLHRDRADTLAANSGGGFRYLIVDDRSRALYSSKREAGWPTTSVPKKAAPTYFRRRSRHAFYSGLSLPVANGGARAWIVAIQDLEYPDNIVDDILDQFPAYGLGLILLLLLLLLGVDWIIVRRALRPVIRASHLVRKLDVAALEVRVPEADLPAEVLPLAKATNEALDRLVRAYQSQRDFTADAAHELRTPLAILRMKTEDLADDTSARALRSGLDGLTRLVNQLLEIAELEGSPVDTRDVVDLSAIAADRVAAIAPLLFRGGRAVELAAEAEAVPVHGNAELIGRALDALLENAGGHTPVGTRVVVSVSADGVLRVEDDGPGIDPGERDLVFGRFWRRSRSPSSGSGLGLAIVANIAAAHDTAVAVDSGVEGGAAFSIRFQPA